MQRLSSRLLVLKGIHARTKSVVLVTDELPLLDESLKRLAYELLAFADVIEDSS